MFSGCLSVCRCVLANAKVHVRACPDAWWHYPTGLPSSFIFRFHRYIHSEIKFIMFEDDKNRVLLLFLPAFSDNS